MHLHLCLKGFRRHGDIESRFKNGNKRSTSLIVLLNIHTALVVFWWSELAPLWPSVKAIPK